MIAVMFPAYLHQMKNTVPKRRGAFYFALDCLLIDVTRVFTRPMLFNAMAANSLKLSLAG